MKQKKRLVEELLGAVKGWRHWVGNGMLDALGVPAIESPMNRDVKFRARLETAGDAAFSDMLEFFELGPFETVQAIWLESGFRLFVSHVTEARERVFVLKGLLERYGISSFLAHEAIKPGKEWREVLLEALSSMDALLSFHSEGFSESEWCGQEVGFALGRNASVISVMAGEEPVGLARAYQGLRWTDPDVAKPGLETKALEAIFESLAKDGRSSPALGEALARRLKFAESWDAAGFCVEHIADCLPLTARAKRTIQLALKLNDQVGGEHTEALLE